MDGFDTARMIHDHPRFERTPIIFLSGVQITDFDRLQGYKLGAVDYILIPVLPEILRSQVPVLPEVHLKRRELQRLHCTLAQANPQLAEAHRVFRPRKPASSNNSMPRCLRPPS